LGDEHRDEGVEVYVSCDDTVECPFPVEERLSEREHEGFFDNILVGVGDKHFLQLIELSIEFGVVVLLCLEPGPL
jgi:hypothetical protein